VQLVFQVGRGLAACTVLLALTTCNWDYRAHLPAIGPHIRDGAVPTSIPTAKPPSVEPVAFEALTAEQAMRHNAAVAVVNDPGAAARPFFLAYGMDYDRALECLATAVYYEAASEPLQGQRAVAQVVLNRLRHPAFPKTVCGVVFQGAERTSGCQFTFTCDGSLATRPTAALWGRARKIAVAALAGTVERSVGEATHYHANWVVPYWADGLTRATAIGAHIFYRWNGFWGTPAAFTGRYAAGEPAVALLLGKAAPFALASNTAPAARSMSQPSPKLVAITPLDDTRLTTTAPLRTLRADLEAGHLDPVLDRHVPLQADLNKPELLADAKR
jgi:spore germination cell wall hydrolase CwlJ-like protein